jgi:hypothetical protein
VVDACDLKRDAKYFCDKWNAAPACQYNSRVHA